MVEGECIHRLRGLFLLQALCKQFENFLCFKLCLNNDIAIKIGQDLFWQFMEVFKFFNIS